MTTPETEPPKFRLQNECVPAHAVYCRNVFTEYYQKISERCKEQANGFDGMPVRSVNHISSEERKVFDEETEEEIQKYIQKKTEIDVMYASGIVSQPELDEDDQVDYLHFEIEEVDENNSNQDKFVRYLIQPRRL